MTPDTEGGRANGAGEIVSEAGRAEEVLAALALKLTTCPWADFVDVVLVGFGDELEWLERAPQGGAHGRRRGRP